MKKVFLFILIPILFLKAQIEIPVLKNYANDFTNTLTNSELNTLNSALKKFDDSTSNQIVFLMISALNGASLEDFTYQTSTKNQIGSKKNNNGVLFFVAKDDRKMRIEVGYGLEGTLPDALASSILRNEVRPYFKQGDYYSGIAAGINAILLATRGEYQGDGGKRGKSTGTGIPFIFVVILFIIISTIFRKGGRGGGGGGILPWIILSSMGNSRRGGGWGSGGFGGGGGGGFGGFSGGGGSFGGGGTSGSW
ncbi:MAG: TPM domain-containing protein [Ignavibacteriales bacterium]|nr:TPM domain-containing protein [Ignavibacteriales bacterium]